MDIIVFLIGMIFLVKADYGWVIAIIVMLASAYLGLALESGGIATFPFEHNVQDTGLLLYVILFLRIVFSNRLTLTNDSLAKPILFFCCFLIVSGLNDIVFNGYSIGDVVRQSRNWVFLSIIFIKNAFSEKAITKALTIILYVTVGMCLMLIAQKISGVHLIGDTRTYILDGEIIERGVKPPYYVILCIFLLYADFFRYSRRSKWVLILILFSTVIVSLKIAYFIALLLGVVCIEILKRDNISSIIPIAISSTLIIAIVMGITFSISPVLQARFFETIGQVQEIKNDEGGGNFSFRILHFLERFNYCMQSPQTALMGIGSVSERNFTDTTFIFGQIDRESEEKAQIDTGDIAWSLLILRLGLIGIALFLVMYWKILSQLLRYRYNKAKSTFAAYMTVNIIFLSFANSNIAYSEFYLLPLLINSISTAKITK